MSEKEINLTIETLRGQMIREAAEKGSLLDENVIAISQQLDLFLVRVQHIKKKQYQQLSKAV